MVLKVKSDETTKPLKGVSEFSTWSLPTLEGSDVPGFQQPVEDEENEELAEISQAEQAKIEAEELKAIRDSAYEEGFSKGQKEGLISAQQKVDTLLNRLTLLMEQLAEPMKQCKEKTESQLLELSFAIARQIVRRELKQDPTQLIAIIREALKMLPAGSQQISISLHPEDAKVINSALSIDSQSETNRWQIVSDLGVEKGSCQVNTENSKIDASIDKQIAVLFSRTVGGQRVGEMQRSQSNTDGDLRQNSSFPESDTEEDMDGLDD